MPTIRVKSHINLSLEEIFDGISQLENKELERFMDQIGRLLAQRKAPSFSQREAELMLSINQGLPQKTLNRYATLSEKMRAETLTEKEHQELIAISEQFEALDAKRLESLIELSRLRSIPLDSLMKDLGLNVDADG